MSNKAAALNITQQPREYNEELHRWFLFWTDNTGNSDRRVAGMLGRSAAAVSQYRNKKFEGNLDGLEKDLLNLRTREEDREFPVEDTEFCKTRISNKIWDVLQACDEDCDMGLVIGPAGVGKTRTIQEYKRRNRSSILIVGDITTKSCGSVLYAIAKKLSSTFHGNRNSELLQRIIDQLKNSRRLLIVDESHFLTWEAFEAVRKIHDCAGIGVCYVGMPRLYAQMQGSKRSYLYDQIFSRIGVRVNITETYSEDVETLIKSLQPNLTKGCIEYLVKKSQGPGKYRTMTKLLSRTVKIHKMTKAPITEELLGKVDKMFFAKG